MALTNVLNLKRSYRTEVVSFARKIQDKRQIKEIVRFVVVDKNFYPMEPVTNALIIREFSKKAVIASVQAAKLDKRF